MLRDLTSSPLSLVLVIFLTCLSFLSIFQKMEPQPLKQKQANTSQKIIQKNTPSPTTQITQVEDEKKEPQHFLFKTFTSPDNSYKLLLYTKEGNFDTCDYEIQNKDNVVIDLKEDEEPKTIGCEEGYGGYNKTVQWAENNILLLEKQSGNLELFNIPKDIKTVYKYDSQEYTFVSVDRNLQRYLFKNNDRENNHDTYVILGKNKEFIKKIILSFPNEVNTFTSTLYDTVNDGTVFITSSYTNDSITTSFDFLPGSSTATRRLLLTKPIPIPPARDCPNANLFSKPGEIIIDQGCYSIDTSYFSDDYMLHLSL